MIYTLTVNPSLDYVMNLNKLKLGQVNRSDNEKILVGGKGINVSVVLKNLGYETIALGFIAGFTGEFIKQNLTELGCKTNFIKVNGNSRINVKIKEQKETEINAQGPIINQDNITELKEQLNKITQDDILIIGGSTANLDQYFYQDIIKKLKDIKIVVDTTKKSLINTLKYRPFLIKPNVAELSEIFNVNIKTEKQIIKYAKKLQEQGAQNVLVSRGKEGAILLTKQQIYIGKSPKGIVVNSTGAGDSMVAGFVAKYVETKDFKQAFEMSIATGSASTFSHNLATKEEINKILEKKEIL